MKKKIFPLLAMCLTIATCSQALVGCENTKQEEKINTVHTVIFNFNDPDKEGESGFSVVEVKHNEKVTKISDPVRTGYVFVGWSRNKTGNEIFDFETPVTEDIKLFAVWKRAVATIRFYTGDGTSVDSQSIDITSGNAKATKPAQDPTWDKHEFTGWYSDSACTQPFDFDQLIEDNTTIYAGWKMLAAVVSFEPNNGEDAFDVVVNFDNGEETVAEPENPTRENYEFIGWFTDVFCTNPYDFSSSVTDSFTLYAGYRLVNAVITFDANYAESPEPSLVTVKVGETIAEMPSAPTRYGYEFTGWYTDSTCETPFDSSTKINDNITLYGGWKKAKFTVTYVSDDATFTTQEVEYESAAPDPETTPTKSGYVFMGWYTEEGNLYDGEAIVGDMTLTAQWQKKQEEHEGAGITFDLNYDGAEDVFVNASDGDKYSSLKIEDPERDGYYFGGWYDDAECTTKTKMSTRFSGSVTLYAKWLQTYVFEAEYTDLRNKQWNGTSDNGTEYGGLNTSIQSAENCSNATELADNVSNGYFVQKMFYNQSTVEFHVYADEAVDDVALSLRLSPDMFDLNFAGTENYKITINDGTTEGTDMFYLDYDLTGAYTEDGGKSGLTWKRLFDDYFISSLISLNEGDNTIKLICNNSNAHTGTVWAEAPNVDCINVSADTTLSWTTGYVFPDLIGQTEADIDYSVRVTSNYSSSTDDTNS